MMPHILQQLSMSFKTNGMVSQFYSCCLPKPALRTLRIITFVVVADLAPLS